MSENNRQSIVNSIVTAESDLDAANISWIYFGLKNVLGGNISHFNLPQTYPGTVNPLLWWTTSNMQVANPSFVDPGLMNSNF